MRFREREFRVGRHFSAFVSGARAIRAAHPLISRIFSGKLCTTLLCECHQTLSLPRESLASETNVIWFPSYDNHNFENFFRYGVT